jgi:hypothetical protein
VDRQREGATHRTAAAGALPGPICYGKGGTQPTVTDAFLVNGFIKQKNFLGGEMSLDVAGARNGILKHVAEPLGMDLLAASTASGADESCGQGAGIDQDRRSRPISWRARREEALARAVRPQTDHGWSGRNSPHGA